MLDYPLVGILLDEVAGIRHSGHHGMGSVPSHSSSSTAGVKEVSFMPQAMPTGLSGAFEPVLQLAPEVRAGITRTGGNPAGKQHLGRLAGCCEKPTRRSAAPSGPVMTSESESAITCLSKCACTSEANSSRERHAIRYRFRFWRGKDNSPLASTSDSATRTRPRTESSFDRRSPAGSPNRRPP